MMAQLCMYAVNPDKDINRFYNIQISKTLFNEYALMINHGRRGGKGRTKVFYYDDPVPLTDKVKHILKRRFSAKGRLGVNYQVMSKSFDQQFNQEVWSILKKNNE